MEQVVFVGLVEVDFVDGFLDIKVVGVIFFFFFSVDGDIFFFYLFLILFCLEDEVSDIYGNSLNGEICSGYYIYFCRQVVYV